MATVHISIEIDSSEAGLLEQIGRALRGTSAPVSVPEITSVPQPDQPAEPEQAPAKKPRTRKKAAKPSGALDDKPVALDGVEVTGTAANDFAAPVGLPAAPEAMATFTAAPAVAAPVVGQQPAPAYNAVPMSATAMPPQGTPTTLPASPGTDLRADDIRVAMGKLMIAPFNFSVEQMREHFLAPFGDGVSFDSIPQENYPAVYAKLRELGVQGV